MVLARLIDFHFIVSERPARQQRFVQSRRLPGLVGRHFMPILGVHDEPVTKTITQVNSDLYVPGKCKFAVEQRRLRCIGIQVVRQCEGALSQVLDEPFSAAALAQFIERNWFAYRNIQVAANPPCGFKEK